MKRLWMVYISLIAVMSLYCGGTSETEVFVDDSVKEYAFLQETGKAETHRSTAEMKKTAVKTGKELTRIWNLGKQGIYSVVEGSSEISRIEKNFNSMNQIDAESFNVIKDSSRSLIQFRKKENGELRGAIPESIFDLHDYEKLGKEFLSEKLNLAEVTEYSSYSIDYERQCDFDGNPINEEFVSCVSLTYRRIFNGGAVRSNISYVQLNFNGKMEIESIEVKWPDFKRVKGDVKMKRQSDTLNIVVNEMSKIKFMVAESGSISVDKIKIVGLERAWYPVDTISEKKLIPVNTVVTKICTVNGEERTKYIDLPLVEGYN